ncbi:MAG: hypothetical protein J07AB43_16710 [Candidatus Nanosalina sp. J07AB43]|nr:MAG: hypothetical protein J07AB43_16710 [Candidatus Nanosalina sp. J07AB43]
MNDTEARKKLVNNILKLNILCLAISAAVGILTDLFYGLMTFGTCIILIPVAKQLIRRKQNK